MYIIEKSTSSGGEGKDSVQGESVDHSWQGAGLASALEGLAFPPAGMQRGLLGRAGDPLLIHQSVRTPPHASTPLGYPRGLGISTQLDATKRTSCYNSKAVILVLRDIVSYFTVVCDHLFYPTKQNL